jgi:hypothetical protein
MNTPVKQTLQKAFNDHFAELMQDIIDVFPDNVDVAAASNSMALMRKANPRLIIGIWNKYVSLKYATQIDNGEIEFFTDKDYGEDTTNMDNSAQVVNAINRIREPVRLMSHENQMKTMKYIQNLKKICVLYFAE